MTTADTLPTVSCQMPTSWPIWKRLRRRAFDSFTESYHSQSQSQMIEHFSLGSKTFLPHETYSLKIYCLSIYAVKWLDDESLLKLCRNSSTVFSPNKIRLTCQRTGKNLYFSLRFISKPITRTRLTFGYSGSQFQTLPISLNWGLYVL